MPGSVSIASSREPTSGELLEIQRQVDATYKNLLDNFDPAVKQLVISGRQLFKSYLTLNDASKGYIDNLNKVASSGLQCKGETNTICTYLSQLCNAWKELNNKHEEIIAFLGTQVLAPTETNLDHDAKILTEQWKGFQRGQKTIEKRIHSNQKKGIPVNGIVDALLKLKTDGLTKATNEEKKRYLFIMERHVAVATLYIELHKQALQLLEENVGKWREMSSNPEIVLRDLFNFIDNLPADETPLGTSNRNNVEVHQEPNLTRTVSSDQRSDSDLSSETKKSSRTPTPVPEHQPEESTELKLLRFTPMPESLKPLMENTTLVEDVEYARIIHAPPSPILLENEVAPIIHSPPSPILLEKEVQTQMLLEIATQTDTVQKSILKNEVNQNAASLIEREEQNNSAFHHVPAVFKPPPPPPTSLPVTEEPIRQVVATHREPPPPPPPPAPVIQPVPPIVDQAKPQIQYPLPVVNSNHSLPIIKQAPVPAPKPISVVTAPAPPPTLLKEAWKTPEPPFVDYAQALYSYNANSTNELGFQEGDVIRIVRVGKSGWQFGENFRTRERGWFPALFVTPTNLKPIPLKEIPELQVHNEPLPVQPRHSPDPPPLRRLIQFEPKPKPLIPPKSTAPKTFAKPPKPSPTPPPPPPPLPAIVENPKEPEIIFQPSTIIVPQTVRPEIHETNYDTVPKSNPFGMVKLRKVVHENGTPKKYQ